MVPSLVQLGSAWFRNLGCPAETSIWLGPVLGSAWFCMVQKPRISLGKCFNLISIYSKLLLATPCPLSCLLFSQSGLGHLLLSSFSFCFYLAQKAWESVLLLIDLPFSVLPCLFHLYPSPTNHKLNSPLPESGRGEFQLVICWGQFTGSMMLV